MHEMCQVIWLELCSMIWHIYHFLKYRFGRFRLLSMLSRSYIFVSKITVILMPFLFRVVSYHFRFGWKMWKWKWRNILPMKPMVFIPISSRRQEHLSYLKINQKLTLLKNSRKSARRLGLTLSINTFVAQPTAQDEANRFGALLTPCLLFTTWQPVHAHLRVKISAGVLWTIVTDELLQKKFNRGG